MNEIVLFLHDGPMTRDTRLFLAGLSSYAATQGWGIQQAVPPDKAGANFLKKLIAFWHPLGVIETCSHGRRLPFFERCPSVPYVLIDSDLAEQKETSLPATSVGFVNYEEAQLIAHFKETGVVGIV